MQAQMELSDETCSSSKTGGYIAIAIAIAIATATIQFSASSSTEKVLLAILWYAIEHILNF